MPVEAVSVSIVRCDTDPAPEVAKVSACGLLRAIFINSATFFAGTRAFTVSAYGPSATFMIGAKSRSES